MSATYRRLLVCTLLSALLVGLLAPSMAQDGGKTEPAAKTAAPAEGEKTGEAKTGEATKTEAAKTEAAKTEAAKTGETAKTAEAPAEPAAQMPERVSLDALKRRGASTGSSLWDRFRSVIGMFFLLGVCFALSNNRSKVSWKLVGWGLGLQLLLGVLVMKTPLGRAVFQGVNDLFTSLMTCSEAGSEFLFGNLAHVNNVPVGAGGPFGPVSNTGQVASVGSYFAFNVLPTIIFFSSLMAVLYHVGFMQWVVKGVAWVMLRTMGTSGSETLSASGNIFVGQTEAPLLVRPFISGMTQSELMAVMTGGFATVAGGVMAAYVGMLKGSFTDIAGHLLSASVMSAPAALVCAKLMIPEPVPERSETYGELKVDLEKVDANVIDAAARGAGDGLKLALNVGAMLMAFIALIFLFNSLLGWGSNKVADGVYGKTWTARVAELRAEVEDTADLEGSSKEAALEPLAKKARALGREALRAEDSLKVEVVFGGDVASKLEGEALTLRVDDLDAKEPRIAGVEPLAPSASTFRGVLKDDTAEKTWRGLKLEMLLGWLLAPLAWIMGVPWSDAVAIGQLIGVKTVLNEFVAYIQLAGQLQAGQIHHPRSVVIVVYALCGFANFGSIAIQIGGISGIAPDRRQDLARLGLKAMIAGTIAALLTATVAGILV
ncbi:MAG: nucleoside transporter C-terminal domain-containing protein [Planctomycetota bacterium]